MNPTFNALTTEQLRFLKSLGGIKRKDALNMFNKEYSLDINLHTFKAWMLKLNIPASGDGRFDGSQKPWAKGISKKEFWERYSQESKEKLLNPMREANKTAKVGDVHIKSGTPYITISLNYSLPFDKRRKQLDRFIWEKHNGDIPSDSMIIHLNGNRLDCTMQNLAMVKKSWRPYLLRYVHSTDPEINKTAIKICELQDLLKGE